MSFPCPIPSIPIADWDEVYPPAPRHELPDEDLEQLAIQAALDLAIARGTPFEVWRDEQGLHLRVGDRTA